MPKIKTREKVQDIKVLDKAAIAGRRMKNAALRAKEQVARLGDRGEEVPTEYAGDRVERAARQAAQGAVIGAKRAVWKGRQAFQADKSKNPGLGSEPSPRSGAPQSDPDVNAPATKQASMQLDISKTEPPKIAVERGRALAKRQAAERTVVRRQAEQSNLPLPIKTREAATAVESTPAPQVKEYHRVPKTTRQRSKLVPRGRGRTAVPTRALTVQAAQQSAQRAFMAEQQMALATQSKAKNTKKGIKGASEAVKRAARAATAAARSLTAALAAGGGTVSLVLVMILLPGLLLGSCFGIFFSGHDSGTGQTMPVVVREINREFEDRIEAIQNETPHDDVEISASQARWPEVLAVYAVKTTTDLTNAQEVATVTAEKKTLLKEIFWTMHEVSSYTTSSSHTVTSTVPAEGGGSEEVSDTVTTTTLHITITHRSVDEMANEYGFSTSQRQQLHELLSEENRRLWTALLSGLGDGDDTIVAVALSQFGNRGGELYWRWYGFDQHVNWCACFVSWCADQCGYLEAGTFPKFSYCPAGVKWFQDAGRWQDSTFEPRPGDIIFFDWEGGGTTDHVGIVEKVENGWIYTIEGNCNDACTQVVYPPGDSCIFGFGTPQLQS